MITSPKKEERPDVPNQVFEKFLQVLGEAGASTELVARLRKTLLDDRVFTERALKDAVLGEESTS